ncbi:tripeptidyl-peptidase-like protein [Chaetomium strumarium]|uniref:tripeptidyl-peptidase II n=1 Tax=Chaetomium strumarium TaxID=1170767 RepID=A0AAJ0M2B4_9PEZI|nr:tripeptidyl-peptidase-like protein [Chaetomium strumarium]
MWQLALIALLGLAVTLVHAAPAVILEQAEGIPPGWSFYGNASASDKIMLFIALKEPGIAELKSKLNQRHASDHLSSDLGRHLSRDEVLQRRQPAATTTRAVSGWLRSSGIQQVHRQGSLISFEASAEAVKSLFQADLAYYAYNGSDAAPVLRALSYTVPAWLRDAIDFVHPLTNFMPPPPHRGRRRPPKPWWPPHPKPKPTKRPPTPGGPSISSTKTVTPTAIPTVSVPDPNENPFPNLPCLAATVPDCIKELYNIRYNPANESQPSPVRFGVAGFLEQWILYSDVAQFLDTFTPDLSLSSYNFSVTLFNNGTNPQTSPRNAGIEASLDVQYAMALGHPTHVTYYSTGGRGTKLNTTSGEPLEPLEEPSYADDEASVPRGYASRVCDMFAALAARGVSVLAATGDGGAAGTGQTRCGEEAQAAAPRFVPTFPASCPYVTAVGATQNVAPPVAGAVFSAGGFSDFFARPAWQDDVVAPYVSRFSVAQNGTTTNATGPGRRLPLFNPSGRATPDISAIGKAFQIVMGGSVSQVYGTSASAPVVAAMVALVNDARMRAGKPSLGWLNPLLYGERVRAVLRDVTEGQSRGCRFADGSMSPGWSAAAGYDCVTGLGVVGDFSEFLAALL